MALAMCLRELTSVEEWVFGSGVRYSPFAISRFKKFRLPVAQSAPRNKRKGWAQFLGWATTKACYIIHTRPCWAKRGRGRLGKVGDLSGSVGSNDNKAADDFRVLTTDCWLDFQSAAWLAFLNLLTELKPNQKLKIRLSSYYTNTHTPPLAHIINGNLINDGMAKNHWGDVFWAA